MFANGKLDISFSHIDIDFLRKYEKWLRGKETKEITQIYLDSFENSQVDEVMKRVYFRFMIPKEVVNNRRGITQLRIIASISRFLQLNNILDHNNVY